jgi:hypothetical protein
VLHFFVLGLAVFGLHAVLEQSEPSPEDPFLVEVSSADMDWFRTMWRKRMGREPTVEELRAQVHQSIREQVLSREAVSLGLDENDTVVRRRLAQKMDFLFNDLSAGAQPPEGELQAYLRENRVRYETPGEASFTQVYFNADERGLGPAAEAARQLIERLNASESSSLALEDLGDPFLLPSGYTNKTLTEIRVEFGSPFADAVWRQPIDKWQGPVRSGYGLHAVRVHDRSDAKAPDFHEMEDRVRADWMADRQRELADEAYRDLRGRYRVLVEGFPYDLDVEE